MRHIFVLSILSLMVMTAPGTQSESPEASASIIRSVVLFLNHTEAGKDVPLGSGFLVRAGDDVLLVTADHVTQGLYPGWTLAVVGDNGQAAPLSLGKAPWTRSDRSDVAVTRLLPDNDALRGGLLARALPIAYLEARPNPPDTDVVLTVLGFPLGLYSPEHFGPLLIETKAASGILRQARFDTGEACDFIFLQQPSIGGLSGAPVFDMGKSYLLSDNQLRPRHGISIVGIMHGTVSDTSGGKLAAVVPSAEIVRVLRGKKTPSSDAR
jgi:hypothetical protein